MKPLPFLLALFTAVAGAQDLPAEVRQAMEIREKEIHRINLAYARKLDELLARYKSAGDTKNAAAVEKLIAEVESPSGLPASPPVGEKLPKALAESRIAWLTGKWTRDTDGSVWVFKKGGGGTVNGKQRIQASYDPGRQQVIVTSDKTTDILHFSDDRDTVTGTIVTDGKKKPFTLTRLK